MRVSKRTAKGAIESSACAHVEREREREIGQRSVCARRERVSFLFLALSFARPLPRREGRKPGSSLFFFFFSSFLLFTRRRLARRVRLRPAAPSRSTPSARPCAASPAGARCSPRPCLQCAPLNFDTHRVGVWASDVSRESSRTRTRSLPTRERDRIGDLRRPNESKTTKRYCAVGHWVRAVLRQLRQRLRHHTRFRDRERKRERED